MTKLTLTEQEELFAKDCKLINLRYEYTNYTGKEKWAVVTELTEKELRKKYPDIVKRYTPFVLLSMAQGEVINESDRNDDKYEKRAKRTLDVYGYEDDISEQFHRELITPFADSFEQAEEEQLEIEKEQLRRMEIAKVRKVLEMMKPIQKERLCKVVLMGLSSRKIAQEEGVNYSAVDKSIAAAIKNFKKYYENL
ncbi:MAG: sigma-70 family RNA polymerase sigma factor [Pseudoruminococcus massiliensis]|uniref:sigma-70 family RNA polymerase sigma factor n=1 Tax=Pseudoruminococcus massiliensis TaxID=2086583 RepID=UPI002F92DCA0